ncbi:MAG: hypothetical protein MJZ76_04750, partial [Bacteroidales bacterium]|nr:hypothetical protein [Bacteroidales bacterium]
QCQMKRLPLFLFVVLAYVFEGSAQHLTPTNYMQKVPASVNLQKISDSIYYDNDEIRVIDYMEYQFWVKRIFGKESSEYRATLPDTSIIRSQISFVNPETYATHPAYKNFPILGVSPEQARAYCRWRTDRVAEYMLAQMKFREWESEQNPDNFFTIQNNDHLPANLYWLIFSLPSETTETRYGFRCAAQWQSL